MNTEITAKQLRRAADLKERIETLEAELTSLLSRTVEPTGRRGMSATARARIAAAQRARWSKVRAGSNGTVARKGRRRMSEAAKARLAAVARARWKKAKAAGKNAL